MVSLRNAHLWLLLAAVAFIAVLCLPAHAEVTIDDGKTYPDYYKTEGTKTTCPGVKVVIDYDLPSEGGAAGSDVILLNPNMMNKQLKAVRLFVFAHECGHTQPEIGDSELLADKFGVFKGVEEGWLDQAGVAQVCDSFEDAPATSSHPSGRTRCTANQRWFEEASKNKEERAPDAQRIVPLNPTPEPTYPAPEDTPKFNWHTPFWWHWFF